MSFRLAAYAVCVEGERVLLARFVAPTGETHWTLPGGKVEHAEDPFDAVIREPGAALRTGTESRWPGGIPVGRMGRVLTDLWPQYGLTIVTPRLELRLPREEELAELADLAGRGVHRPEERPFLTPWTEGTAADRARFVLRGHWHALASWEETAWCLSLGVFQAGRPIGVVSLRARDFPVVRQVTTSAWLGLAEQGRGYGTEARTGLLALAFDQLGAEAALSEVFQDNHASQGVSRKLGYSHDGISVDARDGEALVSDRLRLTRQRWHERPRPTVTVHGMDACRVSFGL